MDDKTKKTLVIGGLAVGGIAAGGITAYYLINKVKDIFSGMPYEEIMAFMMQMQRNMMDMMAMVQGMVMDAIASAQATLMAIAEAAGQIVQSTLNTLTNMANSALQTANNAIAASEHVAALMSAAMENMTTAAVNAVNTAANAAVTIAANASHAAENAAVAIANAIITVGGQVTGTINNALAHAASAIGGLAGLLNMRIPTAVLPDGTTVPNITQKWLGGAWRTLTGQAPPSNLWSLFQADSPADVVAWLQAQWANLTGTGGTGGTGGVGLGGGTGTITRWALEYNAAGQHVITIYFSDGNVTSVSTESTLRSVMTQYGASQADIDAAVATLVYGHPIPQPTGGWVTLNRAPWTWSFSAWSIDVNNQIVPRALGEYPMYNVADAYGVTEFLRLDEIEYRMMEGGYVLGEIIPVTSEMNAARSAQGTEQAYVQHTVTTGPASPNY